MKHGKENLAGSWMLYSDDIYIDGENQSYNTVCIYQYNIGNAPIFRIDYYKDEQNRLFDEGNFVDTDIITIDIARALWETLIRNGFKKINRKPKSIEEE